MKRFSGVWILTDMDGTLLDSRGELSQADRAAVDHFIEEGGLFSVATGRARRSVERFLPQLRTSAPSIVDNGAWITELDSGRTLRQAALGVEAGEIVRGVVERFPMVGVEVCLPGVQYVVNHNAYTERHHRNVGLELRRRTAEEIPLPWLKINLLEEHEVLLDAMEYVTRQHNGRVFAQFSLPHIYEITAAGFSKGDSALWLRDWLGVRPADFYAVGDGTNDLELLAAAGPNACAPCNARPAVLARARCVLPENGAAIAALVAQLDKKYP